MTKRITTDDLARMVENGFRETAKATDMNAQFAKMENRFDTIDTRLDRIENLKKNTQSKQAPRIGRCVGFRPNCETRQTQSQYQPL